MLTQSDAIGPEMNPKSARTYARNSVRNAPVIRLQNDDELREIYKFGRKLGRGSFGAVYEATHIESETKWAIKMVCRPVAGSSMVEMVDNEINNLRQVNHAHIIHLEAVYNTSMRIYLVTELCYGGDLKTLLERKKFFTEDETRYIITSLSDAVFYLHERNIAHRDLKLQNILVKNSLDENNSKVNIKVADFGLSMKTGGIGIGKMMKNPCGTLIYMAPEIMRGRGYSHWCDVWSIGVIMFMLLCGEPPFVSETKEELLKMIMQKGVQFTQSAWATVSDGAKHILTCLLCVDPAHRLSAHELLDSFWIRGESSVPVGPANVLKMMFDYQENEKKKLEVIDFEDTLEPPLTMTVLSKDANNKSERQAELSLEQGKRNAKPPAPKELSHAGEKSTAKSGGEQRRVKRTSTKTRNKTPTQPKQKSRQHHSSVKDGCSCESSVRSKTKYH